MLHTLSNALSADALSRLASCLSRVPETERQNRIELIADALWLVPRGDTIIWSAEADHMWQYSKWHRQMIYSGVGWSTVPNTTCCLHLKNWNLRDVLKPDAVDRLKKHIAASFDRDYIITKYAQILVDARNGDTIEFDGIFWRLDKMVATEITSTEITSTEITSTEITSIEITSTEITSIEMRMSRVAL